MHADQPPRRQPWVRRCNQWLNAVCSNRTAPAVTTISIAMAAAGAVSPASSMFSTATEASVVFGERRKTTAETVVMALMKKYSYAMFEFSRTEQNDIVFLYK